MDADIDADILSAEFVDGYSGGEGVGGVVAFAVQRGADPEDGFCVRAHDVGDAAHGVNAGLVVVGPEYDMAVGGEFGEAACFAPCVGAEHPCGGDGFTGEDCGGGVGGFFAFGEDDGGVGCGGEFVGVEW